ncbi:MAG: M48 family metallopeptidase, partial [Peptostreptococcaceae bacterium]
MSKEKVNEIIIVNYKNTDLKIDLIYRKRKNITIQIKPSGDVLLISPFNISKGYLKDVVIEKGEWILQKLEEYKLSEDLYKEKEFVSGEKFMYLGTEYILHVIKEMNEDVIIDKEKLIVKVSDLDKEYVKNKLKLWYKTQSERAVLERLIYLREKNELMLKLIPSKLKVKE